MNSFLRFSSTHSLRNWVSEDDMGYILQENVSGAPSLNSMAWSSSLGGGNLFAASSEKTFAYSLYCSGMELSVTTFFSFDAASAHCWARFILLMVMCTSSPSSRFAFRAVCFTWNKIRDICAHSGGLFLVVFIDTRVSVDVPPCQSILGLKVCNHGNPNRALS